MKTLTAISALLLLATSLCAQGPTAAAKSAKANLNRKEIRHLRKMKKQALRFGNSDRVCVRLADHSQAEGQLMGVTNEGIQIGIWFPKCGDHTMPDSKQHHSSRFITFGKIRSIKISESDRTNYFFFGAELGLLGPLGWLGELAILTGGD